MMKKIKSIDFFFPVALLLGLSMHIFFLFIVPFSNDEGFYASIPFRLINGDSLIQHEWHLSQFSALFSYLPVYIWTALKGTTEGMFIFLRCVYLAIHTSVAIGIYAFFRKYGKWAIVAALLFYIQMPYRIQAISYHSMFVVFLLLLSLCLISVYEKNNVKSYVFAGICFGCCCVCNPLFCIVFALYLFVCALWTKRGSFKNIALKIKSPKASSENKKLTKKQKRQQNQELPNVFPNMENYTCFFNKNAILWFCCGILIIAIVSVMFFFLTGGTFDSVLINLENLLGSSEYDVASDSIFSKIGATIGYFSMATIGMPWILPVVFIVLLLDKKRRNNAHRLFYLFVSLVWSVIFTFGVLRNPEIYVCAISLPFFVVSTICYILTENKNKVLFYCMYAPCLIATFCHYLAADTHWAAIGLVLAVNTVAGTFFAMDLCKEMHFDSKQITEAKAGKVLSVLCRSLIILGLILQMLFCGVFYLYGQILGNEAPKATKGPYLGMYMTQEQHETYNKTINDLDYIKSISNKNDPVLIASYNNWMYMYLERPIATYTTWYRGSLDSKQLMAYYKANPEKTPKYIYIESANPDSQIVQNAMNITQEMFTFTKQDLSNGVLLVVEYQNYW